MNETELLLLKCVKCYMHNTQLDEAIDFGVDIWEKLYQLANEQRLLPVVYEIICHNSSFVKKDNLIKEHWRKKSIVSIIDQVNKSQAFLNLYEQVHKDNLNCIVTKGLILRELYEKKEWRTSGDEDVLVDKESFSQLHQLLIDNEYYVLNEDYIDDLEVVVYDNYKSNLHLEVHKVLFGKETVYNYFNDFFVNVFNEKRELVIDNRAIQIMEPQTQLLYLICHAFKHFVNLGVGLRQIMDIGMYSLKYHQEIDWHLLFNNIEKFNGDKFVGCIYAILNDYLGIAYDQINFPVDKIDYELDYYPFLKDLFAGGIYGKAQSKRTYGHLLVNPMLKGKRKHLLLNIFFPSKDNLKQSYPILNEHPYLLLYVWIKRAIRFIKRYRKDYSKNNISIKGIILENNERVNLLKKYEIIK